MKTKLQLKLPPKAKTVLTKLQKAGYQAYFVGGSVRDLLLGKIPKDWDIATDARPEKVQKLFPRNFYDNKFGTVTVLPQKIEITTFRKEAQYSDKRHPDKVVFTDSLEEDLKRRDFTINALAYDGKALFGTAVDIEKRLVRAVGDPAKRFEEDALRLIRAVRFVAELGFKLETKTERAILNNHKLLKFVAEERVRDEFVKIIMSERPKLGIELLRKLKLLSFVVPELLSGVGVSQNKHHSFSVYRHSLECLESAKERHYVLAVRLAALFHDIGKPKTKQGQGPEATFYNHDIVGTHLARRIMERLKFDGETSKKVAKLVRYHMFLSDPEKITESGARRLIRKVGKDNIQDLINLRVSDRLGSGVPKARPWRLRHFEYLLDKVSRDPIDVQMLKIDGNDVMQILQISPGKRVGMLLNGLLNEVLDDPGKNTKSKLKKILLELHKLPDKTLEEITKELGFKTEEKELLERRRFGV